MNDRHFVKKHKLKEVNGSRGAYEQWMEGHKGSRSKGFKRNDDLDARFGRIIEDVRANTDGLTEDDAMYSNDQPSTPQFLMGEAVEHLQGRQREIYILTMREGKSLAEAAKVLGMAKGTAQTYKTRAIKFIEQYCKTAMARGRV
jgi:DNA-directed RNA polymerase specialized sigma24 family protein